MISKNLGKKTTSLIEYNKCFMELLKLNELRAYKEVKTMEDKTRKRMGTNQSVKTKLLKIKFKPFIIKGNDKVREYLFNAARSFCSYLKSGERAHLKRRAIASPNIILRGMLLITEEFHLKLGKDMPGSTISLGGEEKKNKIISSFQEVTNYPNSQAASAQQTSDATKWNECHQASNFALQHLTFFDPLIRKEMRLAPPTSEETTFLWISLMTDLLIDIKRVTLGDGPMAYSDGFHNRLKWKPDHIPRMNNQTKEKVSSAMEWVEDETYLRAPYGMLMGMKNAQSTTVAIAKRGYKMEKLYFDLVECQSSDDS